MNAPKQNEYLLLFRGDAWYNRLSPEELQKAMSQFKAWFDRLTEEGKLKAAQPLVRDGKIVSGKQGGVVSDGPFAESKEAIGGYFLLAASSLEEAIAVAKSSPSLEYGTQIEVRPVAEECPMAARARQIMPEAQLAHAAA
jgi:hypothetical protein